MYIPPSFMVTDRDMLFDFVDRHSFATLFSHDEHGPVASHLPLLLDRESGKLFGHFARANPHWQTAAERTVLVVFHGPHAYVSPSWYAAQNVVPTWNYVAVHATGTLRLIEDPAHVRDILERTVTKYESPRPQPWSTSSPEPEFLEKLQTAIVGFEIEVTHWEGKWKLSQNHPEERRARVIEALRSSSNSDDRAVADLMRNTK